MAHELSLPAPPAWRLKRRVALALLALAVTAVHLLLGSALAERLALFEAGPPAPRRLAAVFVRELRPAPPPKVGRVALLPRGPRPLALPAPEPAASQPAPDPAPPLPVPPEAPAEAPEAVAEVAQAGAPPVEQPIEAPADAASAAPAPAFEWPASTRLSFVLNGNYRGPIQGSATVEWVREGDRYQVQLDAVVGLSVAPLFTRRMTSDGTLGPDGLAPRRYDEETRRAFGEPRRHVVVFERDEVVLATGERRPRWPGVQDSASQFVQLTWRFRLQPQLLAVGNVVEVPLALPRRLDRWTYDVAGTETLYPPFGPVETFRLVPRREPRPGGDLSAEMWFAPALDYLPVRIRIRQDADTWVDMTIEKPPLQAER